ncbi:MAG TPA: hypothetical protein VM553_12165 [Dongiaceae bacterium]|nr:hypothetical protein [Dongiaceae bacterium]
MKEEHKRRKLRNRLALDPLLQKGGAHGKSKKAERAAQKQQTRKQAMNRGDDSSPFHFCVYLSLPRVR